MKVKQERFFVVIHGHFYQPPRENPWIEAIEKQPTAYPYHDWNERIAYECYIPNSNARVKNLQNKTIDVVNNYSYISKFGLKRLQDEKEIDPQGSSKDIFHNRRIRRLMYVAK